ncbi:MAG: hypothetical protein QG635_2302 [Bacteroidota bacterium]|nr:hypothetical protein [Bacteroidota bacterium]
MKFISDVVINYYDNFIGYKIISALLGAMLKFFILLIYIIR